MDPDFPYSDPTFPVSPGSRTDVDRNVGRSLSAPPDPARSVDMAQLGTEQVPAHRAGHNHWVHLLMCALMLLVVGYLVVTDKAGGGAILYAVGCLAMMGVMMALMNHGPDDHSSGHRH